MNESEYKIRNLESSIVYLQQEHANMLKLLHKEINDLQMKNSDLTFQISMQSLGVPMDTSDDADNADVSVGVQIDPLNDEIGKLEEQVSLLNSENESKSKQLDSYERTVSLLSKDMEKLKKSHEVRVIALEIELNNKSAEIVQLSTKLHNWKKLEMRSGNIGDLDRCSRSAGQLVPGGPPRIMQLRNQISVHRDDSPARGRPIVARHALVSTAHPVRSRAVHAVPQCAVSTEERSNFSKSVKRPTILPPINSTRHPGDSRSSAAGTNNASACLRDLSSGLMDSFCLGCCETPNRELFASSSVAAAGALLKTASSCATVNHIATCSSGAAPPKIVQLDIDRLIDMGHTATVTSGNGASGGGTNNSHVTMSTSLWPLLLPTAGHNYRDHYSP